MVPIPWIYRIRLATILTDHGLSREVPQLGILHKGVHAGKHAHNQASDAVAESLLQQVALEEYDERPEQEVAGVHGMNRFTFLLCGQRGVEAKFPKMVADAPFCVVIKWTRELANRTLDDQILMHGHIVISGTALSKEADLVVRIDAGVAYPAPVEIVSPRN